MYELKRSIAPQVEKFEIRFAKTTSISAKLEIFTCINYSFHSSIFLKVALTKVAYFHRIFGILNNLDNTVKNLRAIVPVISEIFVLLTLFYKSNRPHFLRAYRRNTETHLRCWENTKKASIKGEKRLI